ncbi:HEL171Cp [Eremothecium sinecaudum]|uniref:Octanoyltransferase n=1 Tax=Eremothecium sinecaudum TaxID=45286 RepID=A0A0X8HTG0_9SACH|nr:HEL171Cp [Eremothecium sinecaudum]AMD21110.1 HEL171Cp [Eremothecium sinecaudum]
MIHTMGLAFKLHFRGGLLKQLVRTLQTAKTYPVNSAASKLKHIHFTELVPFEAGLKLQEYYVSKYLELKRLTSKNPSQNLHEDNSKTGESLVTDTTHNKITPLILSFQFEPTYTGGKRIKRSITPEEISSYENFIPEVQKGNKKPKFVQVERGGQVTFHGPGQMVAYIILDLKGFHNFPARCLVSAIETATINTLKNVPKNANQTPLGLKAITTNDTGVWVNEKQKIASLGINVRRSITSHGLCINVNPDLSYMDRFTMCGLPDSEATSIWEKVPDATCTVDQLAVTFVDEIAKLLGVKEIERISMDEIQL